jgi:hypothetical protein
VILEQALPPLIREWSAVCGLPSDEAKARLRQLLADEQGRIESNWIVSRFLADDPETVAAQTRRFTAQPVAPAPSGPSATSYPPIAARRIRIDDVVGMIDAVRETDRTLSPAPA